MIGLQRFLEGILSVAQLLPSTSSIDTDSVPCSPTPLFLLGFYTFPCWLFPSTALEILMTLSQQSCVCLYFSLFLSLYRFLAQVCFSSYSPDEAGMLSLEPLVHRQLKPHMQGSLQWELQTGHYTSFWQIQVSSIKQSRILQRSRCQHCEMSFLLYTAAFMMACLVHGLARDYNEVTQW